MPNGSGDPSGRVTLYVGNLPAGTTRNLVRNLFVAAGCDALEIELTPLPEDALTSRAFVQVPEQQAEQAIAALFGREVEGRVLRVNLKRERSAPGIRDGRNAGRAERVSLHIANLPYRVDIEEMRALLRTHGLVPQRVVLPLDEAGDNRGYAFVDVPWADVETALAVLDGRELGGRTLKATRARPQRRRPTD